MHWNLPGNPVDLEQREGRVHCFKGHEVRKNAASEFFSAILGEDADRDPVGGRVARGGVAPDGPSELFPYWIFPGPAKIERYVPAAPLSRKIVAFEELKNKVANYRLALGQPRQDDLLALLGDTPDADWLLLDVSPTNMRTLERSPVDQETTTAARGLAPDPVR